MVEIGGDLPSRHYPKFVHIFQLPSGIKRPRFMNVLYFLAVFLIRRGSLFYNKKDFFEIHDVQVWYRLYYNTTTVNGTTQVDF